MTKFIDKYIIDKTRVNIFGAEYHKDNSCKCYDVIILKRDNDFICIKRDDGGDEWLNIRHICSIMPARI